uniref:NADH-ubiquinone oxidoreductase chain 2 n=1 Tax=Pollicipes polymerus TaxID=36137 RepID=Q6SL18_POLPY|nr:NADH dehydrogenase subunit 2 [Pollicipes polymerus]AAS00855.1 NADH dehydrogenase subunit 2 [Pollicipes polymerus]
MLMYFPPFIYTFFVFLGTLVAISSNSMFGMWLGLEINLMAFIPMIINLEFNKKSTEAAIKYFLIQALASAMVIFAVMLFFVFNSFFSSVAPKIFMSIALCTKLGMAPFHFWFPEVLEGLTWVNSLILLTWQKISPLVILSFFLLNKFVLILAVASALLGAISGINQTSMRKILAFSSISHMGWITTIMIANSTLWVDYFMIYSITSFILCVSFWTLNLNYFSQLVLIKDMKKKFMVFINLLSLGGLPPLLGFFPKWLAIYLLKWKFSVLMLLIFSSLVTLFFYTRLCFSTFTLHTQNNTWFSKENNKKSSWVLSILMLFSILGIIPLSLMIL